MGKVDVIQEIFDSFGLIRQHYMEVIIPLILLLLISAGASGGSLFGSRGNSSFPSSFSASPAANAMVDGGIGAALLALGGMLLVLVAIGIVLVIIMVVLERAVWFYVYEHFYSIIRKKKITQAWQQRLKRLAIKAVVIDAFWLVILAIIFALPISIAWNAMGSLQEPTFAGVIAALGPAALAFIVALLVLAVLGFLLTPLWVFYAMDGLGFFGSVSRSLSLVAGNLVSFLLLGIIFGLLAAGSLYASLVACCFSFIVAPILSVFIGLLWGVTLMKVKLKIEK